jgi:aminopeptidase YwaD
MARTGRRSRCASRTLLALLFLVASCGTERPLATPTPSLTSAPTFAPPTATPRTVQVSEFDVVNAMAHDRTLAVTIGIRETGTPGDVRTANYIVSQLHDIGMQVRQQSFPLPKGGTSTNIIGIPPGFDENKPYLIVGGHRDSLRGPGANDNGTGIATSLEVARALSVRPAALPVLYVAFGAEEIEPDRNHSHHVGSKAYVAAMSDAARRNLVAFVNIDMVGIGSQIHCPRMVTGSREGADRCARIARELKIPVVEEVQPNYSDHGTFILANMDAGWIWAGDDLCCYHSPRDTYVRVQPAEVDRAGRLALALLRSYRAG